MWDRELIMGGEPRVALSARMLGSLTVTLNGTIVDTLSSRRTRQVLAYLLLHRRAAVPRDVLMETFWPMSSPEIARNNLHVALNGVRQVLRVASPRHVQAQRRRGMGGRGGLWAALRRGQARR
jgi:DNA-binding SARP family transcriptional activator